MSSKIIYAYGYGYSTHPPPPHMIMVIVVCPPCIRLWRAGLWLYMSSSIMNAYGYGYSTLSPMHMVMAGLMASWVIIINEYVYGYSTPPSSPCMWLWRAGLWLYMSSKIKNAYGYGFIVVCPPCIRSLRAGLWLYMSSTNKCILEMHMVMVIYKFHNNK